VSGDSRLPAASNPTRLSLSPARQLIRWRLTGHPRPGRSPASRLRDAIRVSFIARPAASRLPAAHRQATSFTQLDRSRPPGCARTSLTTCDLMSHDQPVLCSLARNAGLRSPEDRPLAVALVRPPRVFLPGRGETRRPSPAPEGTAGAGVPLPSALGPEVVPEAAEGLQGQQHRVDLYLIMMHRFLMWIRLPSSSSAAGSCR
jgi:hypothetical protein